MLSGDGRLCMFSNFGNKRGVTEMGGVNQLPQKYIPNPLDVSTNQTWCKLNSDLTWKIHRHSIYTKKCCNLINIEITWKMLNMKILRYYL
jgi:hypothetical protein